MITNQQLAKALAAGLALSSFYSVSAIAQQATASGEVRRVNAEDGKVTIKHGAIADLQLPAMTLVYRADPALLAGIQPSDKVTFTAKRDNDQYTIIQLSK